MSQCSCTFIAKRYNQYYSVNIECPIRCQPQAQGHLARCEKGMNENKIILVTNSDISLNTCPSVGIQQTIFNVNLMPMSISL